MCMDIIIRLYAHDCTKYIPPVYIHLSGHYDVIMTSLLRGLSTGMLHTDLQQSNMAPDGQRMYNIDFIRRA